MPHAAITRNLGRSRSWRKATVRSLTQALLKYERIETTLARAKEAQRLAERLVTLGKAGSLAARRQALALLNDRGLVTRLFSDVAPRFSGRNGGYTRILHGGIRGGDGASLATIEWTTLSEKLKPAEKPKTKKEKEPPRPAAARVEPPEAPERPKAPPEKPKAEAHPPGKKEREKPKGFLEGLRKFFKGRPKK
ncbi:MAG: 50S ribosomal protein L17 [Candidatus Omnitrophica bacterium]|nr:50S ribosomal protein L17 [Candidatus Omnitrophota bacterium]